MAADNVTGILLLLRAHLDYIKMCSFVNEKG